MDKITIPKADVGYNITLTATDSAGTAKDCSTYTTYKLQVWKPGLDPDTAANLTINSAFSWTSAAGGTGYYTIRTGDFATAGTYHARLYLAKTGVEEKLSTFAIVVPDTTLYCTVDEVKRAFNITVDTEDDEIQRMCANAKAFIDDVCHRTFATSTAATRYFDGGDQVLFPDDILTITTLKVDADCDGTYEDSYTEGTDYVLEPYNTTPKTTIKISSRATRNYSNFGGKGNKKIVQIVGDFGYQATVPAKVRECALMKACDSYKLQQSGYTGIIGSNEFGEARLGNYIDQKVRRMLNEGNLVKREFC